MIIINANPVKIRAAIHTCAHKDIRYYLVGILIEGEKDYTRIVATDGSIASIQGHRAENQGTGVFILPLNIAKLINLKDTICEFISADAGETWVMKTESVNTNFTPTVGRFPDWRRIVPKPEYDVEQIPSQFNPELLAKFSKAAKILGEKGVYVTHNGKNAALVTISLTDFIGVLAPIDPSYVEKNLIKYFDPKLTANLLTE